MYITRRITAELLSLIAQLPVVAIIGPRQVGKTTLAKHLMKNIVRNLYDFLTEQLSNLLT